MNIKNSVWSCLAWSVLSLTMISNSVYAADCPADIKAVTNDDVTVPVEILVFLVKPLTKCELEVEAQAWLLLLKQKVTEISTAEVAAIHKRDEIEQTEEMVDALDDVKQAKDNADHEEANDAHEDAAEALKELKESEAELAKDKGLQQAIVAAKDVAADEQESGEDGKGESEPMTATEKSIKEKTDVKTALVKHVTDLMADRTSIIDRLNIVLVDLDDKGGKIKEYEAYVNAVSGIKVDVTDASATWISITGWLKSDEGGVRWVVNLIKFFVIVFVFYLLSIVAEKAAKKAFSTSKHFSLLLSDFLVISTRRLVLLIGFFVGMSALEINIGPVLAIVGAAGFVIAFALQNSLSNFASGILMLVYRPFDLGDVIKVAGTLGTVESMNLLSTQLRTPDNQLVIVPNNSVWGDVIVNVTGITQRRVDMVFGIGYNDDIDKAQKILEDIVNANKSVLKEPKAIVKLHELADSSVNFVCRPWVKPADYWDVYWDVTQKVKRRFDSAGISIPFPQQDIHLYQQVLESKGSDSKA